MSKKILYLRWKFVLWQLRRAESKRDTLMDDDMINDIDERIWELRSKSEVLCCKYYGGLL